MLASNIAFWSKYPDMNLTQIVVAVALHTLQIPPSPSSRKGQEQGLCAARLCWGAEATNEDYLHTPTPLTAWKYKFLDDDKTKMDKCYRKRGLKTLPN